MEILNQKGISLILFMFLSLLSCPAFAYTPATITFSCLKNPLDSSIYKCTVNDCSSGIFIIGNFAGLPINISQMVMGGDFPITFFDTSRYERSFGVQSNGTVKITVICFGPDNIGVKGQNLAVTGSAGLTDQCVSCSSTQVSSNCNNGECTVTCDGQNAGTLNCPNGVSQNTANGVSQVCCADNSGTVCTPNQVQGCKVCDVVGSGWIDNGSICPVGQSCIGGTCVAAQICIPYEVQGCKVCCSIGTVWHDNNSKCPTGQTCHGGICMEINSQCISCASANISSNCNSGSCRVVCAGVYAGTINCPNGVSQNTANGASQVCCK